MSQNAVALTGRVTQLGRKRVTAGGIQLHEWLLHHESLLSLEGGKLAAACAIPVISFTEPPSGDKPILVHGMLIQRRGQGFSLCASHVTPWENF